MATVNPRINVTLNKANLNAVSTLAKDQRKSLSAVVQDLVEEALELQDAERFIKVSEERKTEKVTPLFRVKKLFGLNDNE